MRALAAAKLPIELAVVFFRDPTARIAVIAKLGFRLLGRAGAELAAVPEPLSEADFVPRKHLPEILVTGEAFAAEPAAVIPIQIAMGGQLQIRAEVRALGGVPTVRTPLNGFGAVAPRFSFAGPLNAKEAAFSDTWLEAPRDGFQVAPADQRTPEVLGPSTPLSFFNLSQGGGIMGLTLPRIAPFALLVEGRGVGNAHRAAMRCDTVHLDTSSGLLHLGYRGEVELDRFATVPDVVVGLLSGQQVPRAADIQTAFASGVELSLHRLVREKAVADHQTRNVMNRTQRVSARSKSATLPFVREPGFSVRPTVALPLPIPPPPDDLSAAHGPGGTLSVAAGVAFPVLGNWRLGALIRDLDERIVYEAKHTTTQARGRLTCLVSRDEGAVERFRADVARRMRVDHPGLPAILELGAAEDRPFLVEGALSGELLQHVLARGPLPFDRAMTVFRGVAGALAAAHAASLVFASLSPKLVAVDGDTVVLETPTGFRMSGDARTPKPRLVIDDAYASPEVRAEQWAEVREQSDVWSLAALLLALLAGKPVARRTDPAFPALSAKLERVLLRARADSPANRQATAADLLREVDDARPPSFTTPPTVDDEPTADPRGTLPLIDESVFAAVLHPPSSLEAIANASITSRPTGADDEDRPTLPPSPLDDMETTMTPESLDDEHPTIPPPLHLRAGRPPLPPLHIDAETTSVLELPAPRRRDEETTGLIQLPLRTPETETALPFAPRAPSTGRPPPPKDDAIPFASPDTTASGRETLLESAIAAAALPFAASSPRTPPAPRPSARGGTPWEKPQSTVPPPDMGNERNGGTLPPPPPIDEAALARSFGHGAALPDHGATSVALPSVWRDPPRRSTTLDAATIARVVTAHDATIAIVGSETSRLDFALGLEEWMALIDADAQASDGARLEELLSALHTEALAVAKAH